MSASATQTLERLRRVSVLGEVGMLCVDKGRCVYLPC